MHGRRADNPLTSASKHSCCCVIPSFDFYLNLTAMFPARVPNFLTNALRNQRVTLAEEVSGAPMGDTAVILLALRWPLKQKTACCCVLRSRVGGRTGGLLVCVCVCRRVRCCHLGKAVTEVKSECVRVWEWVGRRNESKCEKSVCDL